MKISYIENEIKKLELLKSVLEMDIQNDSHRIYRAYIETERLSETKKIIDRYGITQEDGNKFQVNDISKFILKEHKEVDEITRQIAIKILKKNKTKR